MTSLTSPVSSAAGVVDIPATVPIDFFLPQPPNAKYVAGTPGNDVLVGGDQADYFAPGGGYDRIDGGGGVDTVELRDSHSAFTLGLGSGAGSDIVSSLAVPANVVALLNVERLQFTDSTVALNAGGAATDPVEAAYVALAETLHVVYLGRPAEHSGLEVMVARLKAAHAPLGGTADFLAAAKPGSDLANLLEGLANSAESAGLHKGDTGHFVGAIYQQMLGRAADAGGLAFWSEAIDSGRLSRSAAALSILDGAERIGGADAALAHNRVLAAINFNLALDSDVEYLHYSSGNGAEAARAMLQHVDQHTNTLVFETTIIDTLQKIVEAPLFAEVQHTAMTAQLVGVDQAPWTA